MSRKRLNFVARVIIAITAGGIGVFIILASIPPARLLGPFPALIGTPQAIKTSFDYPALYVRVVHPALVTFPPEWNVTDQFCMGLVFQRGDSTSVLDYDDSVPQAQWDARPSDAIVVDYYSLVLFAGDNARVKFDNVQLVDQMTARAKYRVAWYGEQPLYLYKNQTVAGLLCYHFYFLLENDTFHVPMDHSLGISARNAQIYSYPKFYFRYNPTPKAGDPPPPMQESFRVSREAVTDFLAALAKEAPNVVMPLTSAEADRLATEIPQTATPVSG